MSRLLCVFFAFFASVAFVDAGDKDHGIFWSEDFSRMNVGPAGGFGQKCVIKEEAGMKYLHGTGWMLGKMSYFGASKWSDYAFTFKFRFTNPKNTIFYPFVKAQGKRGKFKFLWYYLNFNSTRLSIRCHGIKDKDLPEKYKTKVVKYADVGLPPLRANVWYKMRIEVTFDKLKVFLSNADGKLVELAKFNVVPGSGGCGILSYAPIDLVDMSVVKLK